MNENCIFCKIINGDIPCAMIYQDEETFAFLDINPINDGHTLIIPKHHHENIFSTPSDIFAKMAITAQKIAKRQKEILGADGINIGMNNEPDAGQVVFHAHIHVMPRFKNDGYDLWKGKTYKEGEIEKIQNKLKF
ncbi:MAG: HIT family protein [Candidatus Nomurabacteria bacterium]|nr:HIT family protein [Candidatus Nomurabacteria bacterium]